MQGTYLRNYEQPVAGAGGIPKCRVKPVFDTVVFSEIDLSEHESLWIKGDHSSRMYAALRRID
jgi:hypothetical protein